MWLMAITRCRPGDNYVVGFAETGLDGWTVASRMSTRAPSHAGDSHTGAALRFATEAD